MFTLLYLNRILKPTCYDTNCPSVQIKDKKGITKFENRTCDKCSLYHSTITAIVAHKRLYKGRKNLESDDEESCENKEDKTWISDDGANGEEDVDTNSNIFHQINRFFGI